MKLLPFTEFTNSLSDFVVGPEGNASWRWKDNGFVIKASGCNMSSMTHDDVVACDLSGNKISIDSKRPSMEVGFHSWLYQNTDSKVIAHTHPTNVMKVLCAGLARKFAKSRLFPDQVVFNGTESCVIPYATPGEELVCEIARVLEDYTVIPKVLLLENHGLICCAKDFKEALTMTQICDKAAEIFMDIQSFSPTYLTEEQINKVKNHESEVYRKQL
jgi:L-fuculose-phosphate aldolase